MEKIKFMSSDKFSTLGVVRIMEIPSRRVISNLSKISEGKKIIDRDSLEWKQCEALINSKFNDVYSSFGDITDNIVIKKIPNDFINDTIFYDFTFEGGLFAVVTCFSDKAGEVYGLLQEWINEHELFSIDSLSTGGNRWDVYGYGLTPDEVHKALGATPDVYQWDLIIPINIKS